MRTFLRRSPNLVCHWSDDGLVIENYATREKLRADLLAFEILNVCTCARDVDDITARLNHQSARAIHLAIELLKAFSLLESVGPDTEGNLAAESAWDKWGVEAKYFQWATRDCSFIRPEELGAYHQAKVSEGPTPPAFKVHPDAERISLPSAAEISTPFSDVLQRRRTRRFFNSQPITLSELATTLYWTWGVTKWVNTEAWGRVGLKTSPSGGARHPIEVYVAVHYVDGLEPGYYHYAPATHELEIIRLGDVKSSAEAHCGNQWWVERAAALFFMTAVMERTAWLYNFSRALRAVYMEAGHLCQTFCLTATALELAPFCTIAFADSMIEKALGLDGINESMLYVTALGHADPEPD